VGLEATEHFAVRTKVIDRHGATAVAGWRAASIRGVESRRLYAVSPAAIVTASGMFAIGPVAVLLLNRVHPAGMSTRSA